MNQVFKDIRSKAAALPVDERAELAKELILSLEQISKRTSKSAWDKEIQKRVKEIKSGKAKGRPAADVLGDIRAAFS